MRAISRLLVGVALLLGLTALPANAGNGAQTFTVTDHNVTQFSINTDDCGLPVGAAVTTTSNSVLHVTVRPGGTFDPNTFEGTNFSATGTQTGTFTAVAGSVTFTGHFASWFGGAVNPTSMAFSDTFNASGTGSDGSAISAHENGHFNLSTAGHVTDFFKAHCSGP